MGMQPFEEIEKQYEQEDPWGYKTNPSDLQRRKILWGISFAYGEGDGFDKFIGFKRCLDIGAGEGWITQGYPALEVCGLEISNQAAERFPNNVKRVVAPEGDYDLVCATGIFYPHYNWPFFMELIQRHASNIVIVSSIEDWEHECVNKIGEELFRATYPYREYKQRTRVFRVKR